MTLPEALSRLAAAGRIRSAWFPRPFDYEPLPSVRLRDDEYETFGETPADDPATVGCLLALLREAMRDPSVYLAPNAESMIRPDGTSPLWFAYTGRGKGPIGVGPTEYAAVVAALDAAAGRLEPTP